MKCFMCSRYLLREASQLVPTSHGSVCDHCVRAMTEIMVRMTRSCDQDKREAA